MRRETHRHARDYASMVYPPIHDTFAAPLPVVSVPLDNVGPTVGQLTQPAVPITRAEKERARLAARLPQTLAPTPPMPARISWATTQAPIAFTLTETRTSRIRTPNR